MKKRYFVTLVLFNGDQNRIFKEILLLSTELTVNLKINAISFEHGSDALLLLYREFR